MEIDVSDNWDYYISTINDKLASGFVDLGISSEAPQEDRRVRLAVLVNQKQSYDNGLPTKEEADALWELEDALVPAVSEWGALFVGRISTDGRRDFFFY